MNKYFLSLLVLCLASERALAETVHVDELFAPQASLAMKVKKAGKATIERVGERWHISGKAPQRIELVPANAAVWDLSKHRLLGLPVLNQQSNVTTINGQLNNGNLTGWSRHAVGFCVAPAKEPVTLGFPFPEVENRYKGPTVFGNQLAKPNGHRMHWRQFFPEDVRALVLNITSSNGEIDLLIGDPFVAWPATPELDQKLLAMPYLDELGQVRAVDWPGKASSIKQARQTYVQELRAAATAAKTQALSRFGGWLDGPRRKATGHFRTEKIDGRWWFVDPDGYLFFSVGACLAGHSSETLINEQRINEGFFAYLPDENDYLRWVGRKKNGNQELAQFPAMNLMRMSGEEWKSINRNGIHHRMRAWGVNTLGSWSDIALQKDGRTPYTLMASIWWQPSGHKTFPSPFRPEFTADLRKALAKFDWAKDDPFCLGVFIGNELEWPDTMAPTLFELPEDDATKQWAINKLKEKYEQIESLNAAWKTNHSRWDEVLLNKPSPLPQALHDDLEPLYLAFTTKFFSGCKAAINEVMPNKLYLGCRTHRGPNVLGRGAAGHADAFSVNVYDSDVRSWQVPNNVDIPIIASEFHFGAVDRGVPSPGLSGSWDQRQRGLSFCNYLASALADPRFVGVHWFQWLDQSAAGRKDRENHQCGFVDVAGHAYPEFTEAVTRATQQMYPARIQEKSQRLAILKRLITE